MMSKPLPFAFLLSIVFHGLVGAAWHVSQRPPAAPPLTVTLHEPAARVETSVPAPPRSELSPSVAPRRSQALPARAVPVLAAAPAVPASPAPEPVAAPASEPGAIAGAAPAKPAGSAAGPAQAPALEPPRYAAAYLSNPPPVYPPAARRRGIEGTVLVDARVSPAGEAREVKLVASAGHQALDDSALKAVSEWRFEPARRGSLAVEGWVRIPVVFRLD